MVGDVQELMLSKYSWSYRYRNDEMILEFGMDNLWSFKLSNSKNHGGNVFAPAVTRLSYMFRPPLNEEQPLSLAKQMVQQKVLLDDLYQQLANAKTQIRTLSDEMNSLLERERIRNLVRTEPLSVTDTVRERIRNLVRTEALPPPDPIFKDTVRSDEKRLSREEIMIMDEENSMPDAMVNEKSDDELKRSFSTAFAEEYDYDNVYNSDDDEETRAAKFAALDARNEALAAERQKKQRLDALDLTLRPRY